MTANIKKTRMFSLTARLAFLSNARLTRFLSYKSESIDKLERVLTGAKCPLQDNKHKKQSAHDNLRPPTIQCPVKVDISLNNAPNHDANVYSPMMVRPTGT